MHACRITLVADVAEVLAGGLASLYCCRGLPATRRCELPGRSWYAVPLDRELDMIRQCYRR